MGGASTRIFQQILMRMTIPLISRLCTIEPALILATKKMHPLLSVGWVIMEPICHVLDIRIAVSFASKPLYFKLYQMSFLCFETVPLELVVGRCDGAR